MLRTPYPPSRLKISDNNDEENFYKKYMRSYKDVAYYDLNHYKTSLFKYKDEDFSDYHHANIEGANKMSQQLVDIIKYQLK